MLQHLDPYEQTIVYIVLCIVITRSIDLNCSWLAFQTSKAAQKRKKKYKSSKLVSRLEIIEFVRPQAGKLLRPATVIKIHNDLSYIIKAPSGIQD